MNTTTNGRKAAMKSAMRIPTIMPLWVYVNLDSGKLKNGKKCGDAEESVDDKIRWDPYGRGAKDYEVPPGLALSYNPLDGEYWIGPAAKMAELKRMADIHLSLIIELEEWFYRVNRVDLEPAKEADPEPALSSPVGAG